MLAHPRMTKKCDIWAKGQAPGFVSVRVMSVDAAVEHDGRPAPGQQQQQQQRRPAALHLPARSPLYGTPSDNNCLASTSGSAAVQQMTAATHAFSNSPTPNRPLSTPRLARCRDSPQSQPQRLPPAPEDDAQSVVGTESQSTKIASEEELYLRRVSVLYHELWTSDWVDKQLFGNEPLVECTTGHDSAATLDSSGGSNDDAYEGAVASEPHQTTPEEALSPTAGCQESVAAMLYSDYDSIADLEGAVFVSTTPQTIPRTMARVDNGADPGYSTTDDHTNAPQSCSNQRRQTLRSLPGDDTHTEAPNDAPCFSSSDLVDALVGTVHRLEDDHTLVQQKRWSVVKELAITEAHYLRDLLLLRAVFFEPLTGNSGSGLLRPEDSLVIFGNLDQVIDCARSLVEYLTVAVVYEANRCCTLGDSAPSDLAQPPAEPLAQLQWRSLNRPASQPEVAHCAASAQVSDSGLRSSAWAEISIAQAFLLAAQRMERVYAQYCRNFEAASQKLVEIKQLASTISASVATPTTMPSTPLTMYRPPSTSSPFADGLKGRRQLHNVGSNNRSGIYSSDATAHDSIGSDHHNMSIQLDLGDTDAMYAAVIHQFMAEQSQLLAGKTTSWDMPSLLIKPVQRILKYPLLIKSLLGLTRQHTSDRNQLDKASQCIERIAETINSVNNINGLRISTATTASATLAASDESQSRIARELRRVLRRRPGNVGHLRTKSISEHPAKEKFWVPSRPKSRAKDTPELPSGGLASSGPPASGVEALIEQHELRISELIRSLRRWESDLGSMLCQQVALVARWKDFYDLPCKELATAAAVAAAAAAPEGYVDLLAPDCDSRSSDELVDLGTVESARSGVGRQFPYSSFERLQMRADPRHCKSHGALRAYSQLALSSRRASGARQSTEPHMALAAGIKSSIPSTTSDRGDGGEGAWKARKRDGVARYHAALEAAYTALYPQCICYPLHSRIYPVLNSLLQVYSDGPRHILGEIAQLSNSSNSSVFSSAEQDGERLARLQRALASDLPKLFDHERNLVRLLLEQIAIFERDFYRQMCDTLATCVDDSPQKVAATPSDPSIRAEYERRVNERIVADSGTAPLPSASECISNIQSSLWTLALEADANGLVPPAIKPRRRRSSTEPAVSADRLPGVLLATDCHLVVPVFEPIVPKSGSAWHGSAASNETVPALPDSRNADEVQQFGTMMWHHIESPMVALPDTLSRPPMSKHSRKKSSGFIERISHLRTGRTSRSPPVSIASGNTDSSPHYDNTDQVKSRARLGLAIDVPASAVRGSFGSDDAYTRPPSAASQCAPSSAASLHGSSSSGWPGSAAARYEPLPVVDSIRFSKGFLSSTFDVIGLYEPCENSSSAATDAATTTVAEDSM
ncbi:hypothetical protein GGI20_002992 [Coemansia sp. BCRC 34301]|nr:hypothetical protein GGI20_002992 [Coemansia sp. BCRC 34301]